MERTELLGDLDLVRARAPNIEDGPCTRAGVPRSRGLSMPAACFRAERIDLFAAQAVALGAGR